jgi:hypothetical protein
LLRSQFADLLQTGQEALSAELGVPGGYADDRAALPGFHIHLPHPAFQHEVASVHRDLQFMEVFPELRPSPEEVFTFTLPLSLPAGSGINFWSDGRQHARAQWSRHASGRVASTDAGRSAHHVAGPWGHREQSHGAVLVNPMEYSGHRDDAQAS